MASGPGHRRLERVVITGLTLLILGALVAFWVYRRLDDAARDTPVQWAHPWALALLAGAFLIACTRLVLRRMRAPTLAYSRVADLAAIRPGLVMRFIDLPEVLRVLTIALIAVALARPQTYRDEELEVESIDIMVVLDLSLSMRERDMRQNRLDAGQRTIRNFLGTVPRDRVGLVVFAQAPMLQCPLTLDHRTLDQIIADQSIGDVPFRGTAIGDSLALSLAVLRRSDARSKVVILLSDGDSNWTTEFSPLEAKDLAVTMGVRVFTILLGRDARAAGGRPGRHPVDPALLRDIAGGTGGQFFHAEDEDRLARGFQQVRETLELTRRRIRTGVLDSDLYPFLVWPALLLLLLELLLRATRWRRFP